MSSISFLPSFKPINLERFPSPDDFINRQPEQENTMMKALHHLAFVGSTISSLKDRVAIAEKKAPKALWSLACYFFKNLPQAAATWIPCPLPSLCKKEKITRWPISETAYESLQGTNEKFLRNTCGLVCFAPAAILTAGLITQGSSTLLQALGILSNFILLITAGFNTYLMSGDIGVIPDGQGGFNVRGGMRVFPIQQIKDDFNTLSIILKEKWASSEDTEKTKIFDYCTQIKTHWSKIRALIIMCGITTELVDGILEPFAIAINDVIKRPVSHPE